MTFSLSFLSWTVPNQGTGRPATGRTFYRATMKNTILFQRSGDEKRAKPPQSHLLRLRLRGPLRSEAIQQIKRLLIRSSLMSLSTPVTGHMIEDLSGSPRHTCSGYQFWPVTGFRIDRHWFCTYLSCSLNQGDHVLLSELLLFLSFSFLSLFFGPIPP